MNQYEIAVLYHPDLEVDLTKAEDRVKKVIHRQWRGYKSHRQLGKTQASLHHQKAGARYLRILHR